MTISPHVHLVRVHLLQGPVVSFDVGVVRADVHEGIVQRQHIFTHVIWHMQVVRLTVEERNDVSGYIWYTGSEPIPEAFSKCLP